MARPRKIVLPEGTITLTGFTVESANALEFLITGRSLEQPVQVPVVETVVEEEKIDPLTLNETAFAIRKNEKEYEIVEVNFNYLTRQAKVGNTIHKSLNKFKCVDAMKLALGQYTNRKVD